MAFKLPSHMRRARSGNLHFRIAIPQDLRHHFGRKEIYRSLGTPAVKAAAVEAHRLAAAFCLAFKELREQAMAKKSNPPPLRADLSVFVNLDELMRPTGLQFKSDPGDPPEAMAQAIEAAGRAFGPQTKPAAPAKATMKLSEYIDGYLDSTPAEHRPNEKTMESYRAAVETFIEIVGDKELSSLTVEDQNRFEDVILKLPANRSKLEAARGLDVDAVLDLRLPPMSVQNAKNIARRATKFLRWASKREGKPLPFVLLDHVRVTKKLKGGKKRRAFTDAELKIVFAPDTLGVSNQASPYMFWMPLIGVHTGMRINEIAQLDLSDIVEIDGITCFSVTDQPDPEEEAELAQAKSVKTEAAKRIVPIHDALLRLGLLEYGKALRSAGHGKLFPDLSPGRDGPGQAASKQFARYCDRIGLSDSMLVFHSFRHGAVGRMRSAHVQKELRMVVVGHSALEDTHDSYGDMHGDYSVHDKKKAIQALDFDQVINYDALRERAPGPEELRRSLARKGRLKSRTGK